MAQTERRRHTRLGAPDNFAQQQAVRMQRHMMPVLFVGGYGKHHRRIWRQRLNLWPFHVGELHGKSGLSDQAGVPRNQKQEDQLDRHEAISISSKR